jgi:small subunit ribosomal protein S21
MPKVTSRSNESQQQMFRRFRKVVTRSGVFSEVRKRRWFISKSEQRRMAKKKAIRRHKRNQMKYSGSRKYKRKTRSSG